MAKAKSISIHFTQQHGCHIHQLATDNKDANEQFLSYLRCPLLILHFTYCEMANIGVEKCYINLLCDVKGDDTILQSEIEYSHFFVFDLLVQGQLVYTARYYWGQCYFSVKTIVCIILQKVLCSSQQWSDCTPSSPKCPPLVQAYQLRIALS